MPGVCHEDGRGKIDPAVSESVPDLKVGRSIPNDRQLAVHRPGLVRSEVFEGRQRFWSRDRRTDLPELCLHLRHVSRLVCEAIGRHYYLRRIGSWGCEVGLQVLVEGVAVFFDEILQIVVILLAVYLSGDGRAERKNATPVEAAS